MLEEYRTAHNLTKDELLSQIDSWLQQNTMNTTEAAITLRIGERGVRNASERGKFPMYRVKGFALFLRDAIEHYKNTRQNTGPRLDDHQE